jgi:hypothetical protein
MTFTLLLLFSAPYFKKGKSPPPQIKKLCLAGHQWLMPIILATQEAEIRRIAIQSQPQQIVCETLSQKNHHEKGLVEWLKMKALNSSQYNNKKKNCA